MTTVNNEQKQQEAKGSEPIQISCFYLDQTFCGIDIDLVQEINDDLTITEVPLSPEYVLGIMNLRGQIVTVIDQGQKLGFDRAEIDHSSRIIIVRWQGEHVGLLVDEVTDVITSDKSDIVEPPSNIKGAQGKFFKGVVKRPNEELLAILNIEAILAEE